MARGRSLRQSQTAEADERLLIEAAQRDPARFAALYDLYFDRIYAYVAWRAASRDEAEDMVSEVFQKALANLRAVRVARRAVFRMAISDRGE
jgi:DNA-directed RNA polymerase specialized sigma24 family protein